MIDPKKLGSTLGLREMHAMQVMALMQFVELAIDLAALSGDREIVLETEAAADELIRMFGGNGVRIEIEDENGVSVTRH